MNLRNMDIRKWVLGHKFASACIALAVTHFGIYSLQKAAKVKKQPEESHIGTHDKKES